LEGEALLNSSTRSVWINRSALIVGGLVAMLLLSSLAQAGGYARYERRSNSEPALSQQLWPRISQQLSLPPYVSQPAVQKWLRWYQRNPVHISRLQERASPWIGHVLAAVEERQLPVELALLPAVESAYDPLAYSHGQAAGLWQFIPSTATHLGLERNWWFDARRDVPLSTVAALDYLEYLHRRFDDWMLALAAYNAGEGNVSGAIKRNKRNGKPTDFWSLKLPKETQAYVPKLLALAELLRRPTKYQVSFLNMPYGSRFEVIETGGQLDIAQAAEMADLSVDTLRLHNPGLNRWATPPDGPHRLLLPTYAAEKFSQQLAGLAKAERVTWRRHSIAPGETLSEIALRYRTSLKLLRQVNGLDGKPIQPGQKLLVASGQKSLAKYPTLDPSSSGRQVAQRRDYQVQDGESLWLIARRHDLRIADIERWNQINRKKPLRPGQRLVLWLPKGHKAKPGGPTHTVVSGDNLWDLAKKYKLKLSKLKQWNRLQSGQLLKLGQVLRLSPPPLHVASGPVRKVSYAVRSGDSLDRIARKFGVSIAQLCDWNDINPSRYLRPGQQLRVHVPVREQWQDA
jgi:membrane-bound lytic murein transglycosylase D